MRYAVSPVFEKSFAGNIQVVLACPKNDLFDFVTVTRYFRMCYRCVHLEEITASLSEASTL
jgi:hypothetical protein